MNAIIKKEQVAELMQAAVQSRILPSAVDIATVFCVVQTGTELGFKPMQSLRFVHIIKGKATLSADALVALCLNSEACEYFIHVELTDKVATFETKRKSSPRPQCYSFTLEEAQRAGLSGGDNWKKYPKQMLAARAKAALARLAYPDLCGGLYDPEEISSAPIPVAAESGPVIGDAEFASADKVQDYLERIGGAGFETLALIAADARKEVKAVQRAIGPSWTARKAFLDSKTTEPELLQIVVQEAV